MYLKLKTLEVLENRENISFYIHKMNKNNTSFDPCGDWLERNNHSEYNFTEEVALDYLRACVGPQR